MSVNKKIAKKAASLRMNEARRTNLAAVRNSAFQSGVARSAVVAATFAACGKSPVMALYQATRLELQVGLMSAALARKGDNRPAEKLFTHCRERIEHYAGATGTGKLRGDQKGRRTAIEEAAFLSARVQVSGIFKDAGVKVPETRGGNTAASRKPRPAAKASKGAKAANDSKPVVRSYKTAEQIVEYAGIQAAALLSTINKNAKIAPNALKSAVMDFHAAIKKLA